MQESKVKFKIYMYVNSIWVKTIIKRETNLFQKFTNNSGT